AGGRCAAWGGRRWGGLRCGCVWIPPGTTSKPGSAWPRSTRWRPGQPGWRRPPRGSCLLRGSQESYANLPPWGLHRSAVHCLRLRRPGQAEDRLGRPGGPGRAGGRPGHRRAEPARAPAEAAAERAGRERGRAAGAGRRAGRGPAEGSDGRDGRWRIAKRTAKDRGISTVDRDARHIHKNRTRHQDGFKGHVSFEPETGLFTAVALTCGGGTANHEAAVAPGLIGTEDGQLTARPGSYGLRAGVKRVRQIDKATEAR